RVRRSRRPGGRARPRPRPPGAPERILRTRPRRAVPRLPGSRRGALGARRRRGGRAARPRARYRQGLAPRGPPRRMSRRARTALFLAGGAGLVALLAWGFAGLPAFGDYHGVYGHLLNQRSLGQTHAMNTVVAVTFDYRGFDTLGEEFILFASVLGAAPSRREPGAG